MKSILYLFIGLLLLHGSDSSYCSNGSSKKMVPNTINSHTNSLRILSTPDLVNLTTKWAREYGKLNPEVQIEVMTFTGTPESAFQNGGAGLSFISNENNAALSNDSIWKMAVGRDVIVPIINSKNPWLDKINQQGVSPEELAQIFKNPEKQTWGVLLGNTQNAPVHYYLINNETIQSQVATFLATDQHTIEGIPVENGDAMISAIQKDPYGIGFCEMTDVLDLGNQRFVDNVKLLPIDKNRNGTLDYFENIYSDVHVFMRGVWIGKYPKDLCRTIYSISSVQPSNHTKIAFLTWVLTEGQQFLAPVGNSDLAYSDRQRKKLELLTGSQTNVGMFPGSKFYVNKLNDLSIFSIIIVVLIPFLLAFMIGEAVVRDKRRKKAAVVHAPSISPRVFDTNSVLTPNGLYFDKTHTWAFMEKNGVVRIGIDDFLQHITGPLTRIKMKKPGEKIKKGELLLSLIQNGKQLNIHAPVSGTITAENELLITTASTMNSSPYSDGWVYLIEPTDWLREIRFLTMAEKYKEWLKKEFSRLKDFLAVSVKVNTVEYAPIILQDGGELKDGILADLGPEVWEDFQTKFIDTSI
ncbi:MAG: hypothetical protein V1733_04435 [bacterium]